MPDESENDLDELGEFLNDHYPKFAIMGIFGTITVFLIDNWPGGSESTIARIGIIASLLLFSFPALWIITKTFLQIRENDNQIPTLSEVGYGIICFCTTILLLAISGLFSKYSDVAQFVVEVVFFFLVTLFYMRGYLRGYDGDDSEEVKGSPYIPAFGLWASIYLTFGLFNGELRHITADLLGLDWTFFAPLAIALIALHYIISEGILGVKQITDQKGHSVHNRLQNIVGTWRPRTSLAVSLLTVTIVTFFSRQTAKDTVGPNIGYYRIAGQPAIDFILAHWIILTILFAALLLWNPKSDKWLWRRAVVGQIIALVAVTTALVDILYFIPDGVHVLPLLV